MGPPISRPSNHVLFALTLVAVLVVAGSAQTDRPDSTESDPANTCGPVSDGVDLWVWNHENETRTVSLTVATSNGTLAHRGNVTVPPDENRRLSNVVTEVGEYTVNATTPVNGSGTVSLNRTWWVGDECDSRELVLEDERLQWEQPPLA